jgi:hypothetical protein
MSLGKLRTDGVFTISIRQKRGTFRLSFRERCNLHCLYESVPPLQSAQGWDASPEPKAKQKYNRTLEVRSCQTTQQFKITACSSQQQSLTTSAR